ncbi:MAG: SdrD B-like domain-containing protein [Candidatus Bipolaricaulia bacterium]
MRRLTLILSLFLLYQAAAFAQVELEAISPPKQASPGEFVTHVFSIVNRGAPDRFLLELTPSPGLEPVSPPRTVELATDEEQRLFITVFVTAQAEAGENLLQLKARAESDPSITSSATAIIIVLPQAAVEVFPPPEVQADPGTRVRLEFVVLNRGNLPNSFKLEVTSSPEIVAELEEGQLDLLPGEARRAGVLAMVLPSATMGRLRVTLKASSLTKPEVKAEATAWISVLPPPPQAVGGALYAELPATLEFRLESSPLTEERALALDLLAGGRISEEGALRLELHLADLFEGLEPGLLFGWGTASDSFFLERAADGLRFNYLGLPEAGLKRLELDLRDYLGPPERHDLRLTIAQAEALDLALTAEVSSAEEKVDGALTSTLGFYLNDSFFRLGLALHGPTLGDQVSGELAYRTSGPGRPALTLSLGLSEENLSQRPTVSGITTIRSSISGYHTFGRELPTVRLRAEFEEQFSDGLSPKVNRVERVVYSSLSQPIGQATLAFTASTTRESDRVAGTDYQYSQYEQLLSLRPAGGALLSLRLVEALTADLISGMVTDSSFSLETGLTWRVEALAAALRGAWSEEGLELALRLAVEAPAWAGTIETRASLPLDGAAELGVALEGLLRFNLPLPFILTKARVEGYIFIDEDGDSVRDPGEPGVSGVFLQIGEVTVRSDGEKIGFYRFPPLLPGRYHLMVRQVPAELAPAIPLPIEVELEAGEVLKLDIPLTRAAAILGVVFKDLDRDGRREEGEPGLPRVRLILSDAELVDTYTDSQGEFAFTALLPGRYSLSLDPATLPARYEPTTPTRLELSLQAGEVLRVEFGAAERPRPIVVTFQPPFADFTYAPAEPKAGEEVTFDGSPSFDPDGYIVRYEWDFTGDKATDAEGKIVKWVFPKAGDYPVTLTVTDNDGYTSSATRTISVRG